MPRTVQLFVTCIVDTFLPHVGEAVVTVLERLGHAVELPERQTCCGLPFYNNGYRESARRVAEHNVAAFPSGDPVVVPSGSCAWMMLEVYPQLLGDRGRRFAERVTEFSKLVDTAPVPPSRAPGSYTYHQSCHQLRGLKTTEAGVRALTSVEGLERRPLSRDSECCGFGGTFAVRNAALASDMQADKLRCAIESGAKTLVVSDVGCLLHLACGAKRLDCPVEVRHVAEVLADAAPVEPPR